MTATDTRNFESQPSPEVEGFSFISFIPFWGWLGFFVLAVVCIVGTQTALKKICRFCCTNQPRDRPAAPPTSTQSTDVCDRFVEVEVANERISAANAEIEALLNHNNVSGLRTEPLTTVNNLSVPNHHPTVRPLVPPAIPDLPALNPLYYQIPVSSSHHRELHHSEQTVVTQLDPSTSPPSYNQFPVSNQHHRELMHSEQTMVRQLVDIGCSGYAHMLADSSNRTRSHTYDQHNERPTNAMHDLPRLLTPTTYTRPSTETNIWRNLVRDPAHRSLRTYFNTADRLRERSDNSHTLATFNETNVALTRHQPRPQTPPPMYHEVEQTVVRIARSDGLPSYDEFMATPSLVWYPSPSTNV